MISQKWICLITVYLNLCLMGCSTTQGTVPSLSAADVELKQDYNAKSRDLNKKLHAEWVEIQSLPGKTCDPVTVSTVFEKTKAVEMLKACVGHHSWMVAERWAQFLMEGDVNSPWGPYFMSLIAEGRGQISRAQWMVDLALARAPQIGGFAYQKARLFWKTESFRDALAWATRATELDPDFAPAFFMIGHIHYRDHEWKEARASFQKALAGGMKDADLAFESGECALIDHDKVAALQNYQDALKLGSRSIWLREKIALLQKEEAQARASAIAPQLEVHPGSTPASNRNAASEANPAFAAPVGKNK